LHLHGRRRGASAPSDPSLSPRKKRREALCLVSFKEVGKASAVLNDLHKPVALRAGTDPLCQVKAGLGFFVQRVRIKDDIPQCMSGSHVSLQVVPG
jgi:hypothetical protein